MDPFRALILRTITAVPSLVARYGLHPEAAVRYSLVREVLRILGTDAPAIISGFRSPQKQRCLLENWEAGFQINPDCGMPASKPACRSWHMHTVAGAPASLAIDLDPSDRSMKKFDEWWRLMPFAVSGTTFGDNNHFHVELPLHRPKSIC